MDAKKTIKMAFHCAGVVSYEETDVIEEDDKIIKLKRSEDDVWIFLKRTGRCINDNNSFGAYRRIEPIN